MKRFAPLAAVLDRGQRVSEELAAKASEASAEVCAQKRR